MTRWFGFVFLLLTALAPSWAHAALQEVPATMMVNGYRYDDVPVMADPDNENTFAVSREALKAVLLDSLRPEDFDKYFPIDRQRFMLNDFRKLNFKANFNIRKIEFTLDMPREILKPTAFSFSGKQHMLTRTKALQPESTSLIINTAVNDTFKESDEETPMSGSVESFVNVRGVVLENIQDYEEHLDEPWKRRETRLVYDHLPWKTRFSAGDLFFPVSGFISSVPMAGLSATKDDTLNPGLVGWTTQEAEFVLAYPSQVDVYINGLKSRILQLPAGKYKLTDLPLETGFNDVELWITDSLGRQQKLKFPYLIQSELLAKGWHRFTHNIGMRSFANGADRDYEEDMTYVGQHRWGVTDSFTLGVGAQVHKDSSLGVIEHLQRTGRGLLSTEWAYSNRLDVDGGAARVRYRQTLSQRQWMSDWGIGLESRTKNFATFFGTPQTDSSASVETFFTGQWFPSWRMLVGNQVQIMNDEQSSLVYVRGTRNFFLSSNLSVEVKYRDYPRSEWIGTVEFLYYESRGQVRFQSTSENHANNLDMSLDMHTTQATAGFAKNDSNEQAQASLQHRNQYAQMTVGARYTHDTDLNQTSNEGQLGLGTALVATPSGVLITRPVRDSFVAFRAPENLTSKEVVFQNASFFEEHNAKPGRLTVFSDADSYQERTYKLDLAEMDAADQMEADMWTLTSRYRSGLIHTITNQKVLTLRGALVDVRTAPMGLWTGTYRYCETPDVVAGDFFTNRLGQFELSDVKSKCLVIELTDPTPKRLRIELRPKEESSEYNLGTILVK